MKDIVITSRVIFREAKILALCVLAASVLNACCIFHFHTEWKELYTTLPITLAIALIFFAAVAVARVIAWYGKRVFSKKAA